MLRFSCSSSFFETVLIDFASSKGVTSTDQKSIKRIPAWKRALDLLCVLLAVPFFVPLFLVIALIIKLVSRGPVFFKQERIGHLGRPFVLLKFRSMKVDSSSDVHQAYFASLMKSDAPMTKIDKIGDPRLIPFGRILRSTALDELPQLLNVIRGDMSLVGPRPCTPFEFEKYQPWQRKRFNAFPGLTGLWQVSGKNKTTFNEMIQLDILYASSMSLGMDIKILIRTFPVIFGQVAEMLEKRAPRPKPLPTRLKSPPTPTSVY